MAIITDVTAKGKAALTGVPEGVFIVVIVILASAGSFGLGYLSGRESGGGEVIISERPLQAAPAAEVSGSVVIPKKELAAAAAAAVSEPSKAPALAAGGEYVASKSGKSYHLPWCPGAKQMKEENKIYFGSKAEAEAAGYVPAKNCKGI